MDNGGYLSLQFLDKLSGIVFLMLDVAQLLFPDTCQFTALQQFLVDEVDELDARWGGDEALAVALDIVALEEGLDDAGTRGWAPDAVFLHSGAQCLVFHELARRLHGAQQ